MDGTSISILYSLASATIMVVAFVIGGHFPARSVAETIAAEAAEATKKRLAQHYIEGPSWVCVERNDHALGPLGCQITCVLLERYNGWERVVFYTESISVGDRVSLRLRDETGYLAGTFSPPFGGDILVPDKIWPRAAA